MQLPGSGNVPYFDPRKRVAISRQGYIAMINNNLIHILNARFVLPKAEKWPVIADLGIETRPCTEESRCRDRGG